MAKKPCQSHQVRNPLTGRCKSIEQKKQKKDCRPDQVRNPVTGRCKKVTFAEPEAESESEPEPEPEVKEKVKKPKKPKKDCRPDQFRNPVTGRCKKLPLPQAKEPGSIKKTIRPLPPIPDVFTSDESSENFCGISMKEAKTFAKSMGLSGLVGKNMTKMKDSSVCEALKIIFPDFINRLTCVLGSGQFGTVFCTRGPNGEKTAVKAMLNGSENTFKSVTKELDMGNIFHSLGLAPEMLDFESKRFKTSKEEIIIHFISMGRVDTTVQDYLQKIRTDEELEDLMNKVFDVIIKLKEEGLNHGDFHIGNIGLVVIDGEMEVKLIDYGFSMKKAFVELDIIQLIRVTHFKVRNSNRDRVDQIIRRKAKDMFGLTYPEYTIIGNTLDNKTLDKIESIHERIRATGISMVN